MKRALIIATALVALVVAVVVARGSGSQEPYRFAVVFDDAKGMGRGMVVKLAGAKAGSVEEVRLTADHKARIELSMPHDIGPLSDDARCRILPQGLISEYYVECDVGTSGRLLPEHDGLPTVPVERTETPVALQDVLNVFSTPVNQRLAVLFAELGLSTSARGEDLDAIIRRANPALRDGKRLLEILNRERDQLDEAVTATDRVVADLAADQRGVRRFVRGASGLLQTTARQRKALAVTIGRLPRLLERTDRGLDALDGATTRLTPVLRDVRAATPAITSALDTLPRFTAAARPVIPELSRTAKSLRRTTRSARPLVRRLRSVSRQITPTVIAARRLVVSIRDTGGFEFIERLFSSLALAANAYDGVSHMLTLHVSVVARCMDNPAAAGCSRKYGSSGQGNVPVNDPDGPPQPENFVPARTPPPTQRSSAGERRKIARLLLRTLPPPIGDRR